MVTIPCAVAIPLFRWQISFFQYQHRKVYGVDARHKAFIPIVRQNHSDEPKVNGVDWDLKLPYEMVDSIFEISGDDAREPVFCASNVFYAAKQVLHFLDDDEFVEVQDADIVHIRPYRGPYPADDEVIVNTVYEPWHMHIGSPDAQNVDVIKPLLTHDDGWYPNGGFNTIVRVSTLKLIIDDIIEASLVVGRANKDNPHGWWQQMYGLNVACHNHKIKMISIDNCYFPNINELQPQHHQVHYSCDPIFHKIQFPNINVKDFPSNEFYNTAKEWMTR